MLEAHRIQLVDPPDIEACTFCGTGYLPHLQFVSFDIPIDDESQIPAGAIETVEDRGGVKAYQVRSATGRGVLALKVSKPQVCSECFGHAAKLFGWGDTAPLLAELGQKHEQCVETDKKLEASERERRRLEREVQSLQDRVELAPKRGKRQPAKVG